MAKVYTSEDEIKKFREEMEEDKKDKNKYLKKHKGTIKNIIFGGFVVLLVCILLMVNSIKSQGKVPSIFGFSLYQVETGSMTPTLPIGTIILTKEVSEPKEELKDGDIVTFLWGDKTVTHRIIEVVEENGTKLYKTKGDNPNNSIDPELLHPDNVIGKFVFKIPFTG